MNNKHYVLGGKRRGGKANLVLLPSPLELLLHTKRTGDVGKHVHNSPRLLPCDPVKHGVAQGERVTPWTQLPHVVVVSVWCGGFESNNISFPFKANAHHWMFKDKKRCG